jgi:hypothetical protein
MAKINDSSSYPVKSPPLNGDDTAIGTDSQTTDKETKQLKVQDIADFTLSQSGVVNSVTGPGAVKAQPNTGDVVVDLTNTGVAAGTYSLATVEVDAQGRILSAANGSLSGGVDTVNTLNGDVTIVSGGPGLQVSNTGPSEITITNTASGGGTVTSVTAGTGLDGGTITTTGTIDLADTTVTQGTYTTPEITVNAQGQITGASNINVDLQHVLDNGALANNVGITLVNGSVIATSAVLNSLDVGSGDFLSVTIDQQLLDRNGAFGTDGQVLTADTTGAGGVVWSDPGTYVATATISSAQLNAATPVQVVAAPGANKYIQVVSAAAKYNYGTTTYSFSAPLNLYTNSSSPQFELDEAYLQVPASQIRAMSLTTSGALTENTDLSFAPAAIPSSSGDGNLELNVQYRIVEF